LARVDHRVLVKAGLESLNETRRPGLRALMEAAGLVPGRIKSADIGFGLAPRLNAAGRLDDAVRAYQLLLAEDDAAALAIAADLSQANRRRQDLTRELQEAARARVEELGKLRNPVVFLDSPEYQAGLVGLVASRLVDEFGRPVVLVERGEHTSRGSARSVPGFSIVEALADSAGLLVRYGGHAAAAGFTVETEHLPELERRLLAYAAAHMPEDALSPALEIDAVSPLGAARWELFEQLEALQPFGQGNPQPVLMSERVQVVGAWARGAEGRHLKLRLDDGSGAPIDAMAFKLGHLAPHFARPRQIDVVYTLDRNDWNGNTSLQLTVKDFRSSK
jgi:single-stranded-DNA-specific exonuclease